MAEGIKRGNGRMGIKRTSAFATMTLEARENGAIF